MGYRVRRAKGKFRGLPPHLLFQRTETDDSDLLPRLHQSVQNNGSIWADIFVTPHGRSPIPSAATYTEDTLHVRKSELSRSSTRATPNLSLFWQC